MRFIILYKDVTSSGSNYYKLLVEMANGIWEEAVYFGNTVPKMISKISMYKDGWIAQIQPHVSRDKDTGRYKGKREVV